jgi:HAMP domain-containing protein
MAVEKGGFALRSVIAFLIACALAAAAPLVQRPHAQDPASGFPGWPSAFDGRSLTTRPLAPREARFAAGFPGRIAAFGDGTRLYVVRWVTRATRQLHPAADCFRGAGYAVEPLPMVRDAQGRSWGAFAATRGGVRVLVRERIVGAHGSELTDASSWYWAALLGRSAGPWWAWTVVETDTRPSPRH